MCRTCDDGPPMHVVLGLPEGCIGACERLAIASPLLPPPARTPICTTQERLFDQSDAYRVHICSSCGLIAVANLKKNQFYCTACKNTTGIVQVGRVICPHCRRLVPAGHA